MKTMNLTMNFSVNGAVIAPTNAQYVAIEKFVTATIFGLPESVPPTEKVKYPYGKRVKRAPRLGWSKEEENMARNLRLEQKSWKQISRELEKVFGQHRTSVAIEQHMYKVKRTRVSADAGLVAPGQIPQPLRPNEFGGTDGLKAHNIA